MKLFEVIETRQWEIYEYKFPEFRGELGDEISAPQVNDVNVQEMLVGSNKGDTYHQRVTRLMGMYEPYPGTIYRSGPLTTWLVAKIRRHTMDDGSSQIWVEALGVAVVRKGGMYPRVKRAWINSYQRMVENVQNVFWPRQHVVWYSVNSKLEDFTLDEHEKDMWKKKPFFASDGESVDDLIADQNNRSDPVEIKDHGDAVGAVMVHRREGGRIKGTITVIPKGKELKPNDRVFKLVQDQAREFVKKAAGKV